MNHSKPTPFPWRYVGRRSPYSTRTGGPISSWVVSVSHLQGEWEAIYCNREEDARHVAKMAEQYDSLLKFARMILDRVPECNCSEIYKPYFHRVDPQCSLHAHFDFTEEEIQELKELLAEGE